MEKKIISFKGISNVPDDGLNEAGDMSVLLNMRHKGGELVECRRPNEESGFAGIAQSLYHANSELWLYLTTSGNLHYYNENNTYNNPIDIKEGGVQSFALMGNIVIMNFADRVEYAIWRNGGYEYLGGLPTSFILDFTKKEETGEFTSENQFPTKDRTASDYYKSVNSGLIDKALNYIYEKKGFVDRTIIEYGLRLFDGSYIPVGYSDLDIVTSDRYTIKVKPQLNSSGGVDDRANIITSFTYFTIDFPQKAPIEEGWKDVVLGIDCFCCGSIINFSETKHSYRNRSYDLITEYIYAQKSNKELEKDITDTSFFRVATIGFDSTDIWMTNTSPSSIAQLDTRKDVALSQNLSDKLFVFNNRMHSVSKYKIYDGYTTSSPLSKNNDINSYVFFDGDMNKVTNKKYNGAIGRILIYPNEDALGMSINQNDKGAQFYFNHKKNGKSFYFETSDDSLYVKYNDEYIPLNVPGLYPDYYTIKANLRNDTYGFFITITRLYNGQLVVGSGWTKEVCPELDKYLTLETELEVQIDYKSLSRLKTISINDTKEEIVAKNNIVVEPNVLKVSAVDNPFYFPTAQTYKFEGEIKGLASNAEAISTGQFGAYPLFVFTKEGIWAMQIDTSGKGAYLTQSPFSREVCDGAVCPVSGGVVFTTKRGVMAISGGQVTELSKPLDGLEEMLFNFSGALAGQIFARAGYGDYEKFEPVPIREYIQGESGAKLAYNYLHNEVILSNVNYGYSYVYSLDSQTWGMIDTKFDITTNSYPELVVYNNKESKRYTFDDTTTGVVPVVAITRPFVLGSFDYKRLRQAALRCTFDGQLNFYLLGSNDGAEFKCITGKEVDVDILDSGTYRDLITAMSRSKQYKYFAIAIAGRMSGRVSMAELLVDAGFAVNKLR